MYPLVTTSVLVPQRSLALILLVMKKDSELLLLWKLETSHVHSFRIMYFRYSWTHNVDFSTYFYSFDPMQKFDLRKQCLLILQWNKIIKRQESCCRNLLICDDISKIIAKFIADKIHSVSFSINATVSLQYTV